MHPYGELKQLFKLRLTCKDRHYATQQMFQMRVDRQGFQLGKTTFSTELPLTTYPLQTPSSVTPCRHHVTQFIHFKPVHKNIRFFFVAFQKIASDLFS